MYPNSTPTPCIGDRELLARLFPPNSDSVCLRVLCARGDYSASRIAFAVEDCDVHLLNLNILATSPDPECVCVLLRVGARDGEGVIRSLARYGYDAEVVEAP